VFLDLTGEWIPAFAGMTNMGSIMLFYKTINLNQEEINRDQENRTPLEKP
jgi:hypothetical protein